MKIDRRIAVAGIATLACAPAWAFPPEVGDLAAAPDLYEYVTGEPIVMAALRGKVTVLYFGGDWCQPCQETRPYVYRMASDLAGKVNVLFLSSDDNRDRPAKLNEMRALPPTVRLAMPRLDKYPPGSSPKGMRDAGAIGRVYVFPTAIVLDSQGKVVHKMERGHGIRLGLQGVVTSLVAEGR